MNLSGVVVAKSTVFAGGLAMPTGFSVFPSPPGLSTSTPLTSLFTIVVDMGQTASTTGTGLSFVTIGIGSYSGTTSISLP